VCWVVQETGANVASLLPGLPAALEEFLGALGAFSDASRTNEMRLAAVAALHVSGCLTALPASEGLADSDVSPGAALSTDAHMACCCAIS